MTSPQQAAVAARPPIEAALRHLGTQRGGDLVGLLEHAIERPTGTSGRALEPLARATASLEQWTAPERAYALAQVITEGLNDHDVASHDAPVRLALRAALRLRVPDLKDEWGTSLVERFRQIRANDQLLTLLGHPTTNQPLEAAWTRGVRALTTYLERRFRELRTPADWEQYKPARRPQPPAPPLGLRVQPVFINYWVSTIFLRARAFRRRITERLITAMEDGVSEYLTRSRPPLQGGQPGSTITDTWGCRIETVDFVPHSDILGRLTFDPLADGQQHWFATEAVSTDVVDDRPWIYVRVNTYGIGEGRLSDDGIPIGGLTIRVVFEDGDPPLSNSQDLWMKIF